MAQTEIIALFASVLLLASCNTAPRFSWESYEVDAHRTGVSAPNAENVAEALGTVEGDIYTAPNGRTFAKGSCTYATAVDLIAVQPEMAALKEVIGYSSREMIRKGANCEITNWIVDHIREDVARLTHRKVDLAIINSGGIRVDLPQGDVILDDMVSMLPFRNYLCYVALKGSDVIALFEGMAQRSIQPVSGVKVVVNNHKLDTLLIGGKPVDPDKVYGVGTIDFLLDGGDKLNVGKNAKELIITDCLVIDSMLPYARSFALQGKPIEYFVDDRVIIKGGEEDED